MQTLMDLISHERELEQKTTQAIKDGNLTKRDFVAKELLKTRLAIASFGTKKKQVYQVI